MTKTYYRIDEFDKVVEFEGVLSDEEGVVMTVGPNTSKYYLLGKQCFEDKLLCARMFSHDMASNLTAYKFRYEEAEYQVKRIRHEGSKESL